jgi:hypothetical protein
MLVISIIALISTAGIAFYARFLVALCRELKSLRRIYGYRVRLDCVKPKHSIPRANPFRRANEIEGTTNKRGTKKGRIDVNPRSCSRATGTTLSSLHQALTADSTGSSDARPESWEQVPQQEKKRLVSALA